MSKATKISMVAGVLSFIKNHKEMKGRDAVDLSTLDQIMNEWAVGKKGKAAAAAAVAAAMEGDATKPKRAKTGYLLHSEEKRPTVANLPARERIGALAALWNGLSDDEKAAYNERAKALGAAAPAPVPAAPAQAPAEDEAATAAKPSKAAPRKKKAAKEGAEA